MTEIKTFTPPESIADCGSLLNSKEPILCPDGIARYVFSYGYSGDNIHVTFSDKPMNTEFSAMWSRDNGFETAAEQKNRLWDKGWNDLKEPEKKLIINVFGDVSVREDRRKFKEAPRLVSAAKVRLIKAGKIDYKVCGRCGGSGRYSFNMIDRDRCYGCNGSGKALPSTRDALKVSIVCE